MKNMKGDLEFPSWYGWKNPCTALLCYWNTHGSKTGGNFCITILPLQFWKYFSWRKEKGELEIDPIRTVIGLGFIEIFWDTFND